MTDPKRIQRSRATGWRLPDGAVIVDRSTQWGNPFVTGRAGLAWECVKYYRLMLVGLFTVPTRVGDPTFEEQSVARKFVLDNVASLRGRDLACWCRPGAPCHADVLLEIANRPRCEKVTP